LGGIAILAILNLKENTIVANAPGEGWATIFSKAVPDILGTSVERVLMAGQPAVATEKCPIVLNGTGDGKRHLGLWSRLCVIDHIVVRMIAPGQSRFVARAAGQEVQRI
jgi:hypothetical protein